MSLRTRRMTLRFAIVAAAMVLASTPAVSLASDTAGDDAAQTTVGLAAALDTLPP